MVGDLSEWVMGDIEGMGLKKLLDFQEISVRFYISVKAIITLDVQNCGFFFRRVVGGIGGVLLFDVETRRRDR